MKLDVAGKLESMTAVLGDPPEIRSPIADDDEDGAIPAELRQWLVQLRLLQAVPFAYLVADTALLPAESIRWFYVDRRWTDALVQGALSVGTVNSDDRTHLAAQYPAVRAELDHEERNQRRDKVSGRLPRLTGERGPISGFLLRSKAVSGWPALHVRAFAQDPEQEDDATYPENDPNRLQLLRLERLAPAVLLCLFDGIPEVVHIEEPRQGVQFGFDSRGTSGNLRATLKPRNATTFDYLPGNPIDVQFRTGASGVVDIKRLERDLKPRTGSGAADGLDSSEYALQLVRLPWRQVWGDPEHGGPRVTTVFKPTVNYQVMVDRLFVQDNP
jgi:hypothetical protein